METKSCLVVTLVTSEGNIDIELYDKYAPVACKNFAQLAERGRYDGSVFHRVIKGFIVQGGFLGENADICNTFGHFFDDEISRLTHCGAGIVSSASAGPNLNGTEFFITLSPQPKLDGKYTVFGRVRSGMTVVERIASTIVDENYRPVVPCRVRQCHVQWMPLLRRPWVNSIDEDDTPCPKKRRRERPLLSRLQD